MQKSAKVIKQTAKEVTKAKRQRASSPDPTTKKSRTKSDDKSKSPKRAKAASASQPTEFGSVAKNRPIVKSESKKSQANSPKKSKSKEKKVEAEQAFSVESILEQVKPKKARTGYIFFVKSYMSNVQIESVEQAAETMKAAAKAWSAMSDIEKKPFMQAAEKDIIRHNREMKDLETKGYFVNEDGVKSTDLAQKSRIFKPHVVLPKKVKTPMAIFIKKSFEDKKAKFPEGAKTTEVFKALVKDWAELSEKKQAAFKKLVLADKTRYDREMQELMTQGYFVREDGTRSHNKPIKKEAQTKIEAATAKTGLVKKEETAKGKSAAQVGSKRSKEQVEPKAASKRLKK